HPFRTDSAGETSKRIQAGAPPLGSVRPDLPAALQRAVTSALAPNPARRPSARRFADLLRSDEKKRRKPRPRAAITPARERLAAVVAGLDHRQLPFGAGAAPLGLGITGSRRPAAVGEALWRSLQAHPALIAEALVLAAAAALLPRARGPWPAALYAAGLLAATAFAAPAAPLLPLAATAWITASILAPSGPTTNRCSWLRRWEILPTRSPRGL